MQVLDPLNYACNHQFYSFLSKLPKSITLASCILHKRCQIPTFSQIHPFINIFLALANEIPLNQEGGLVLYQQIAGQLNRPPIFLLFLYIYSFYGHC